MEIIFLLDKPKVPENIGAAARALKTMGFSKLRLINPCDHLSEQAKTIAHGSKDILENAIVYTSLKNAVDDIDFLIGTTAKNRIVKKNFCYIDDLDKFLNLKKNRIKTAGILFGCEENGLSNEEIKLCDIVSSIPMKTKYPSLNLSHAVMLFAFQLSKINLKLCSKNKSIKSEYKTLKIESIELLKKLNFDKKPALYGRILERLAAINSKDTHLILSIFKAIKKFRLI